MPDLKAYYFFRHTLDYRVAKLRNRIAWIDYHNGQYELFVQDIPAGERMQVLTSEGDEGQPLRIIEMSLSGRFLLLTRGNFSDDAPCPNPRQYVQPPSGQMQVVDLEQQKIAISLGEITTATLSPKDHAVVWTNKGTVYSQGFEEEKPRILFSVRGQVTSLNWAPDGRHIAFICQRKERTLLGLFSVGSARIQWVSPGFDRDATPCWSPDSRHLAFLRFQGPAMDVARRLFSHHADNFAIMLADFDNGTVLNIWETGHEEHAGLSLQYGDRPLCWLNDNSLLFSHDNSGWDHIYLFELSSLQGYAITEGSWLVQDYSASSDGRFLAYSHNRSGRHHYTLDVLDMQKKTLLDLPLDTGRQYWRPTLNHNNNYLIFMSGNISTPCNLSYVDLTSKIINSLTPSDNYSTSMAHLFTPPVREIIKSSDARLFHAQIFKPSGRGPHPAIINVHGGPWLQSLPGFHPMLGMSFQYAFCQLLTQCGYLVMDINYRGGSGYGKQFRQAEERGWDGARDYLDVQSAGHWLARQAEVDRSHIGIIGASWGGYLSAMALAQDSSLFRAGVVINGYHSFPRELRRPHWGSSLFNCRAGEIATEGIARAKIAEESSPWGWLDHWMSPVLLIHGDDDRKVSFEESQHLAHALRSHSVDVESLALPGEGHDFLLHDTWLQIGRKVLDFLKKHLQK